MKRVLLIVIALVFPVVSLCAQGNIYEPERGEVFTYHKDGRPIILYRDTLLSNPGAVLFPLYEEYRGWDSDVDWMTGFIVHIAYEYESCFSLKDEGWISLYVNKGDVAINTRNYDGADLVLYEQPFKEAPYIIISKQELTLPVFGIKDGWVKVRYKQYDSIIEGWLPPEMICGNPFTPCC